MSSITSNMVSVNVKKNNLKYWCMVSIIGSSLFCTAQASITSRLREKLEHAAFKHVLLPAYCTWHKLKKAELSYADVVVAGTAAGVCYGLKKLNDRTQYITYGVTQGCAAGKNMLAYMLNNKAKTATGIGLSGALWYLYKAVRADVRYNAITVENFFSLLTKEQRTLLAQLDNSALLVQQAYANPTCLRDCQEFMNLLSKEQQEYLDKVIALHNFCHDSCHDS